MNASITSIEIDRLSRLEPLNRLPQRVLEYIANQTVLEKLAPQTVIHSLGETDDQIRYLLQGDVETCNQAGVPHRISAGTSRSLKPLAACQPFTESVRSIGVVTLLKMPRELYDNILRLAAVAESARSTEASFRENALYLRFHDAILEGKLELPSMPDIAMRIAKVINDPNTGSEDIARVVQADPTVAARLISVVNSAAYRGRASINSLPDAVTRLGRNVIHNLVISFALGSLFRSRSNVLHKRMTALWKHACQIAAISRELGRVTPGLSADHALLCGLVHDIGALPIISAARSHPEIVEQPEVLDRAIQQLKPEIGAMVLKKWEFGDAFINVALHSEDWMQDAGEQPAYLDIVIVAQLHACIGTPKMQRLPRLDLVPAFHKLALGRLTPRHSIGILENARGQISELQNLLSGG